jgi:hypothetical protein
MEFAECVRVLNIRLAILIIIARTGSRMEMECEGKEKPQK